MQTPYVPIAFLPVNDIIISPGTKTDMPGRREAINIRDGTVLWKHRLIELVLHVKCLDALKNIKVMLFL